MWDRATVIVGQEDNFQNPQSPQAPHLVTSGHLDWERWGSWGLAP